MTLRPPLVLIANDHEWATRSIETVLGPAGYAVLRAFTGRQAIDVARSTRPDAIITSMQLSDMTGVELCRLLREDVVSAVTPIIAIASGPVSRAERLEAFDAGVWICMSQPVDGDIMLAQLATFMRAERAADDMLEESLLDTESGLYNARGLARRAREIGAYAQRRREPLACVALTPEASSATLSPAQLDDVSRQVVRHLVALLERSGRLSDVVGRLGQSEFAMILPATEADGAARVVERLQAALGEGGGIALEGVTYPVTLRAGYAAVPDFGSSAFDAVELLLRAAAALRQNRPSMPQRTGAGAEDLRSAFPH